MNIIRVLVSVACLYGIIIQLLRIIWLYYPSFLKNTRLYKSKQPSKVEMLLSFLALILCMAWYIFGTIERIF